MSNTRSTASKSTAATETNAEASTTAKAATATSREAAATAKAAAEATTATEAGTTASEAVLTDFQRTTLPFVAIELGNSVARVIRRLKGNDTRALGATGRVGVHIGTNNGTLLGCEERVQVNSPNAHKGKEKKQNGEEQ
jgi:hypothetical protein